MIKKWFKGMITIYYQWIVFSKMKVTKPLDNDYQENSFILKAVKEHLKDKQFQTTEMGIFFQVVEKEIDSEKMWDLLKFFDIKVTKKKFI